MVDLEVENSEMTEEKSPSKENATTDVQARTVVVQNDLIRKDETDSRRGVCGLFDDEDQQSG